MKSSGSSFDREKDTSLWENVMAEPAPLPHLPVEPVFNRVVERCGGSRVDALFPCGLEWENADYYFHSIPVVAELKEVTTDLNDDTELQARLGKILGRHAGKEGVPIFFGKAPIRIDLLPDDVRREMMTPFKRKLESRVKKAAKQIKETKAQLKVPNARGLLILVNEASTFLSPGIAFFFLHHILNGQHSSIDQVVYCSVNMLVDSPDVPDGARFWANTVVDGRQEIPATFMTSLFDNFREVVDEMTGVPGVPVPLDADTAETLSFIKRKHADTPEHFVQAKRFYKNKLGYSYYCDAVSDVTATLYLVESWQRGELIQALFEQKLIHATVDNYTLITDKGEITRLRKMLTNLRRL